MKEDFNNEKRKNNVKERVLCEKYAKILISILKKTYDLFLSFFVITIFDLPDGAKTVLDVTLK